MLETHSRMRPLLAGRAGPDPDDPEGPADVGELAASALSVLRLDVQIPARSD
ncbi:hypothetical protein [Rhodococcus sp. AG1013]|uniref:hypothetical protein n=1 Tax=Rhodococcus sp. AG1013 TaxID=2183996 RepID=UPI0015F06814|nr:hypothetical protein [Rhodococcus sp. AG1013]